MLAKVKDRALAAWVRLRYGSRGDIPQQALLWALLVVVAVAVLGAIGKRVVNKLQLINNALS